jgi:hypothetical protein
MGMTRIEAELVAIRKLLVIGLQFLVAESGGSQRLRDKLKDLNVVTDTMVDDVIGQAAEGQVRTASGASNAPQAARSEAEEQQP